MAWGLLGKKPAFMGNVVETFIPTLIQNRYVFTFISRLHNHQRLPDNIELTGYIDYLYITGVIGEGVSRVFASR